MSKIALSSNNSGTGTFTIASPDSNTNRTLTLPDITGTLVSTDSSGNVGIGTSSPSFPLDVVSTGVGSLISSRIHRTDGDISLIRIGNQTSGNASGAPAFGSDAAAAVIYTNNAERMRIDNAGKILAAAGTNWKGTVSQSGESSVFETVSNANGVCVKFADGTMICTRDVLVNHTSTGNQSFTWAAAFSSAVLSVEIRFGATSTLSRIDRYNNCCGQGGTTTAIFSIGTGGTAAETVTHTMSGIGRWY